MDNHSIVESQECRRLQVLELRCQLEERGLAVDCRDRKIGRLETRIELLEDIKGCAEALAKGELAKGLQKRSREPGSWVTDEQDEFLLARNETLKLLEKLELLDK